MKQDISEYSLRLAGLDASRKNQGRTVPDYMFNYTIVQSWNIWNLVAYAMEKYKVHHIAWEKKCQQNALMLLHIKEFIKYPVLTKGYEEAPRLTDK